MNDYEKEKGEIMALNKKPVTGMKDVLPAEMQIRDYVINVIQETYAEFGFTRIETPCVENIANLSNKQGGENEKLIFKIMKRGEKLANASSEDELCDSGLRYDLTVPLSRYYANNSAKLPSPFLAMQIGNVWRADRPQKGRYRQFTQCDIDILGDDSVPIDYHVTLWKSEFVDFVILQQDAFDKVDANTSLERQEYMLKKVINVIRSEFKFEGFEEVGTYFKRLINIFRQLNYTIFQSEGFHKIEDEANAVLEERRVK